MTIDIHSVQFYIGNKKIKDVPMFREIPCNKDIYYANTLIKLNSLEHKNTNISNHEHKKSFHFVFSSFSFSNVL